ncbi:MAG TPA: hypothetical protein VH722_08865 [Alphaproteobacteria bacterium]|jgi:hypothetical protein|nr:hypothetical protein [Alphaproteobacteria bacterium]
MNAAYLALTFTIAMSVAIPGASAAAEPKSVAAFCSANPNLDFPDRVFYGKSHHAVSLPPDVAAVGASKWRCKDGKVYVCDGGASGSGCYKMDPSRQPSKDIRETCVDNPGQEFVAAAVIGNSSSTWRCRGSTAEIIETFPLDDRGFLKQTWAPLFDARGKLNSDIELSADPR